MKGKEYWAAILCAALVMFALGGCMANNSTAGGKTDRETESENTQKLLTSDFVVYGEVSSVGEEALTIKLGTLETGKAELTLTGGEVVILMKSGTVLDLEKGDIVSIALDEEGYAETITLMHSSAAVDKENG